MPWETIFYQVYRFFWHYPTKIIIVEMLFCIGLPRRKHFWLRFLPSVSVLLALPYFLGYNIEFLTYSNWLKLSFLMYFLLSAGVVYLCFRFPWKQAFFYCTASYAVEHCFDSLQRVVIKLLRDNVEGLSPVIRKKQRQPRLQRIGFGRNRCFHRQNPLRQLERSGLRGQSYARSLL